MNPLIESQLLPRHLFETKIREGFYFSGQENPPEVLLTIAEYNSANQEINRMKPPNITARSLTNRMKIFASTYHFAFGDKDNRELALASWINALSEFSEDVVRKTLEQLTVKYRSGVLVPAMAIDIAKTLQGDEQREYRRWRRTLETASLFDDSRSKEEYIRDKESQKAKSAEERAKFDALIEQQKVQRKIDEENDKIRNREIHDEKIEQQKARANRLKAVAQILRNVKELNEHLEKAEEIITNLQEGNNDAI